jgi:NADH-quinone oxidoreductase subunit I
LVFGVSPIGFLACRQLNHYPFDAMLGTGLIKGLIETGRNFVGSYHDEARLVTVQYPEEKVPPKENGRNFPFLVFDGNDPHAGLRCVACQICEKECPPQCIYIIKSKDKKPDHVGKPQFYPATFDIDVSVCMSCQICVEVCPVEAIKMDQAFELSTTDRFDKLLMDKSELARPNTYYHQLHPTEAAEVDARLDEDKRKAEAKARADAEAKAKAAAAPAKVASAPPTAPAPASQSPPGILPGQDTKKPTALGNTPTGNRQDAGGTLPSTPPMTSGDAPPEAKP